MALEYVTIKLDKQRRLRYDLNAICEIEEQMGVPITDVANLEATAKNIRLLLWAGLVWEEPGLAPETVGHWVSFDRFQYVCDKVGEAITKAFPSAEGNPPKTQVKHGAGTGSRQKK